MSGQRERLVQSLRYDYFVLPSNGADAESEPVLMRRRYLLGIFDQPILKDWLLYATLFVWTFTTTEWDDVVPASIRGVEDDWPAALKIALSIVPKSLIVPIGVGVLRRVIRRAMHPGKYVRSNGAELAAGSP